MSRKPLCPEEVSQQARPCLDFAEQQLRKISGVQQTAILRTCLACEEEKWLAVTDVRSRGKKFTGYCRSCYYKNPLRGPQAFGWKGGRSKHIDGYIWVRLSAFSEAEQIILRPMAYDYEKHLLEHRAVMALDLGRPLQSWEVVHHANGNRADNRIENLELMPNDQQHGSLTFLTSKEILRLKARIAKLEEIIASLNARAAQG